MFNNTGQHREIVTHTVGTLELAFLSLPPCQALFRSRTQETCAPAEKGLADTTQQPGNGGAAERKRAMRALKMERGEESEIK